MVGLLNCHRSFFVVLSTSGVSFLGSHAAETAPLAHRVRPLA